MNALPRVFASCALLLCLLTAPAAADGDAVTAGEKAEARGQWERAGAHYRSALAADAHSARATRGLARIILQTTRRELYEELADSLRTLAGKDEADSEAQLLLGRLSYRQGEDPAQIYATLHQRLDARLAEDPKSGAAMQWKGRVFFTQGLHELAARRDAAARGLFGRGQGVLYAATRAAPGSFDAWYWLGMVSHYLSDTEAALDGYRKAALLRPYDVRPLLGIHRILSRNPARYEKFLQGLLTTDPQHAQAQYALGVHLLEAGSPDAAIAALTKAAAADPGLADAHYRLGLALAELGEAEKTLAAYERALRADARHEEAADAWGRTLFDRSVQSARRGPAEALAVVQAYEPLLTLTPHNPYPRKSLAYVLQSAWSSHEEDEAWLPVLQASAHWYAACAPLIDRWMASGGGHLPAEQEQSFAQILLDTGSLYEADTPIRDLKTAEARYAQALEISEHGSMEAWSRLGRLYRAQKRWVDLAKLAKACSLGLDFDDGTPNEAARESAMKVLDGIDLATLSVDDLLAVGRYLVENADPERAVQFLEAALAAKEGMDVKRKQEVLPHLGRAQQDAGEPEAALETFRALEVLSGAGTADAVSAAFEQALCLAAVGRKSEAREKLKLVAASPVAPAAVKLRARLEGALLALALHEKEEARALLLALTRELAQDGSDLGKNIRRRAMAALDALDAK